MADSVRSQTLIRRRNSVVAITNGWREACEESTRFPKRSRTGGMYCAGADVVNSKPII
jgi:hypothetical protein